jgi:electron transfer flavoprotein alpha subunit
MDLSYIDLLMAQEDQVAEAEGGGGIWVVVDVVDGELAPVTCEALGAARTLADSLGAYVYSVLVGSGVTDLAGGLYQAGADGVRVADRSFLEPFALEPHLETLTDLFEAEKPEIVLLGATATGEELAPRLAQALQGGLIEHVTAFSLDDATRTVRATVPVYGGEYFEIAACPEARPQFFTIEPGAFGAPFVDPYRRGEPTLLEVRPVRPRLSVVGTADGFKPPEVPLTRAEVVVAAGRQAGDFDLVERLASALGGQVAGDRGARDAGWIDSGRVIDVRGATVSPQVYVAVGIPGDTFHNAAVEGSKFIVAIHPEPDAPIFRVADLCLEANPPDVLPRLLEALEAG